MDLFEIIWKSKLSILCIILFFLGSSFVFQLIKPQKDFIARTEIKPIASFESDEYILYNSHINKIDSNKFFEITPKLLLELTLEQLENGLLFEKAIVKFNLIEKNDFNDINDYEEAVIKLASEIKVEISDSFKKISDDDFKNENTYVLKFIYNDIDKWKQALSFVIVEANKNINKIVKKRFNSITNTLIQKDKFEIEDINTEINLEVVKYEQAIKNELAYLKEQAVIARELGIKNNTLETETYSSPANIVTNVNSHDRPLYYRGYKAIEKTINLIENRSEKKTFIPNILELEMKKRVIQMNKDTARAVKLFFNTPISQDNFKAARINFATTSFEKINNEYLFYIIFIIIGSIIGISYALISHAFKNRKV